MTSAKLCTGSDDLPSWKLINQRVLMNEMLDEGMDLESGSEVDDEEEDLSDETPPLPQQRHSACRSPPYRPFCRPCPVTKDIDGTDIPPHALGTSSWMGEKDDSSIKALEATIAELQRKLDERGKLLRASEELRAALTKENHRLKVANAQMRYMSTPAPFEEQYLVKARGTPPNPNRRKKAAAAYLPVRTSSRVAKRALEVDNLEAKPRKKLARTNTAPSSLSGNYFPTSQPNGGPISSSSSTASTLRDISSVRLDSGTSSHKQYKTVGGSSEHSHAQRDLIGSMWSLGDSEAAPSSVLTRARSYESMEYADGQGQEEELSPKAKGKQRARESTKLDGQLQTGLETPDGGSVVYFASESDLGLGQKNNQGRKILPVTVHPRDPAHAHLPWFDDPTIPLLPRIPENLHGDFEGLESSKMIDSVLATTFGKPGAAAKCNASLVLVLKKFMGAFIIFLIRERSNLIFANPILLARSGF
ncbi:hypothetical protein FRB96_006136 [Tulasnella sp. 330]|nr:hypothetical protein FRB96_006136 [Tulasnella sp. 330]